MQHLPNWSSTAPLLRRVPGWPADRPNCGVGILPGHSAIRVKTQRAGVPSNFQGRAVLVGGIKSSILAGCNICSYLSMANYGDGDGPRHKYVVGVHNSDVPNPWDYALSHDFDFACTFISRPQLQAESLALAPQSPDFNVTLCRNALLRPSGISIRA